VKEMNFIWQRRFAKFLMRTNAQNDYFCFPFSGFGVGVCVVFVVGV